MLWCNKDTPWWPLILADSSALHWGLEVELLASVYSKAGGWDCMWSYGASDRQRRGTCPVLRGSLLIFFRSIDCRLLWSEARKRKLIALPPSYTPAEWKKAEGERGREEGGERECGQGSISIPALNLTLTTDTDPVSKVSRRHGAGSRNPQEANAVCFLRCSRFPLWSQSSGF